MTVAAAALTIGGIGVAGASAPSAHHQKVSACSAYLSYRDYQQAGPSASTALGRQALKDSASKLHSSLGRALLRSANHPTISKATANTIYNGCSTALVYAR